MKKYNSQITAVILLLAFLFPGFMLAQPESQLKGVRRLPRGTTIEKLKQHVIDPEHIRDIQMEEPVKEQFVRLDPSDGKKFKLKPKLNVNRFGEKIHTALKDNVVGYILQVRQNGNLIYNKLWKGARNAPDMPIPWNENAQMHVASVSKFLTAVGLVRLLDRKKISYDAKIIDYLPKYWSKGSNINKITFRHLLRHESGFSTDSSKSDYAFMKGKVAAGVANVGNYDYENMNFGLMRILIPIINGDIDRDAEFFPDNSVNNAMWDGFTIAFYQDYMQDRVFTPAGVNNAGFTPTPFTGALAYSFPQFNIATGWDSGDLTTMAGGAAWRLTTKQLLDVMNHVRRKNTIIPAQKAQYMLENHFGIDQTVETAAGNLYNKNGGWNGNGRKEQCVAYFMPNGMEVVVFVNSPIGTGNASLRGTVSDAFTNSLE